VSKKDKGQSGSHFALPWFPQFLLQFFGLFYRLSAAWFAAG